MSAEEVTRLEVDDSRENPTLDIPALEYGTREMAKDGEAAEILLTHPEETITRGFAEEGMPRRFAPGGTVYHGDTECLHLAYPTDKSLSEFDAEMKWQLESIFSDLTGEDLYWHGRDLLADRDGDPATDPQVAGLAVIDGKDYSIARTCATFSQNTDAVDQMIAEDGLTDPETYRNMNYFFEEEVGKGLQDYLAVDSQVQTVQEYLSDRGLADESYVAARQLQERESGIKPRSCVTDFRP